MHDRMCRKRVGLKGPIFRAILYIQVNLTKERREKGISNLATAF